MPRPSEPKRWLATWTDPATKKRVARRCRTRAQRDALQRRMRDIAWEVREGIRPRSAMAAAEKGGRPIGDMLEQYRQHMVDRGRSAPYVRTTYQTLERIAAAIGWPTPGDVEPVQLSDWLARQDITSRTRAAYAKAWRTMTAWAAAKGGWLAADPLAGLDTSSGGDQAGRRRALTVAEYDRLVSTSSRGEDYALMCHTGLRWTEAAALTMAEVRLADRLIVVPEGVGKTDSDRDSYLPVPQAIADMLAARRQIGSSPILTAPRPASRTWADELEAARIDRETREGKMVPASMRATYSTWLTASGCPDEDRHRLRRDAQDIAEGRYTSMEQIVPRLRPRVEAMVAWCHQQRYNRKAGSA